MHGIEEGG
jgi:hypothetical protein